MVKAEYKTHILKQIKFLILFPILALAILQCKSEESLKVHRVKSSEASFFSNSHIIEGKNSLVVVDVHMSQVDVEVLINTIKNLGKPLEAIVITHRHPDHINGLEFFMKHFSETPILSGPKTVEAIKLNQNAWNVNSGNVKTISPGPIKLAGRNFDIDFYLSSESPESLVMYDVEAKALITGDLVLHGQHLWLAENQLENWLTRLTELKNNYKIKGLYPGHGEKGGAELIQYTEDYIKTFQETIKTSNGYNDAFKKMTNQYPNHEFPQALNFSLGAFGLIQE